MNQTGMWFGRIKAEWRRRENRQKARNSETLQQQEAEMNALINPDHLTVYFYTRTSLTLILYLNYK